MQMWQHLIKARPRATNENRLPYFLFSQYAEIFALPAIAEFRLEKIPHVILHAFEQVYQSEIFGVEIRPDHFMVVVRVNHFIGADNLLGSLVPALVVVGEIIYPWTVRESRRYALRRRNVLRSIAHKHPLHL